jgi:hypothetical protein
MFNSRGITLPLSPQTNKKLVKINVGADMQNKHAVVFKTTLWENTLSRKLMKYH